MKSVNDPTPSSHSQWQPWGSVTILPLEGGGGGEGGEMIFAHPSLPIALEIRQLASNYYLCIGKCKCLCSKWGFQRTVSYTTSTVCYLTNPSSMQC